MKKILISEEGNDHTLGNLRYTNESELQSYLKQYPELIPLEEIMDNPPRLVCIGEEVEVPSGYIDLLYIDEDGTLTIVETKLERNPEIRRKVIGQIMEYASQVVEWSIDDVYSRAEAFLGRSLEEVLWEKNSDLSTEIFRNNLINKLQRGQMRLVIAVDEIVEILRTTVTFLNSNSNLEILLLQVSCFNDGDIRKIMVPLLFGHRKKEMVTPGREMDPLTFLSKCQEGKHTRSIELYQKLNKLKTVREEKGDYINWGIAGYSYRMFHSAKDAFEAPIVGYWDGSIAIRFSTINNCGDAGQMYHERLLSIPIFANSIRDYTAHSEQGFQIDGMTSKEVDEYVNALRELGQTLDYEDLTIR
ncbi:hypothetical protein ACFLUG_02565 [Chloroflexota bacterium]